MKLKKKATTRTESPEQMMTGKSVTMKTTSKSDRLDKHSKVACSLKSLSLSASLFILALASILASSIQLAESNTAVQSFLLDTTEQSFLGWTKYPDGGPQQRSPGWAEESFTNSQHSINWRSFVVCDVAYNGVNNWLWTPFIERNDANRLYIEIKFTMRNCNLFPQMVLSCKETFALLYKEADSPIVQSSLSGNGNVSFAQSDSYMPIGTIAASEGRFSANSDVVINTEVRSIPVGKRGVYFAFRDQGACLSLISIKVYHLQCPQLTANFAKFNATLTGRDLTSLVAVEGNCVPNSIQIEQPKMFCAADGNWNLMSSGLCKCLAGFEPAQNQTKCQACPPGKYKSQLGDSQCSFCPDKSLAPYPGASECKCMDGYFRNPKDPKSMPCTQPPSQVQNLTQVYLDSTSVILSWSRPLLNQREDLVFKLTCDLSFGNSDQQQLIVTSPANLFTINFSETKCIISGLSPSTKYTFQVYSMNGVSTLSREPIQYSEITIQTLKPIPQTTMNTLSSQNGGFQLLPIYNFRALPGARGSDMILAWESSSLQASESGKEMASGQELNEPSLYEVKFQPRYFSNQEQQYRRSPYPASLIDPQQHNQASNLLLQSVTSQPQSITTVNKAVAITTLQPRTEYSFQIRAKLLQNQWTDWSEPIFMLTTNQLPSPTYQDPIQFSPEGPIIGFPFGPSQQPQIPSSSNSFANSSASSWLSSFAFILLCTLIILAFISVTLIHYKKSLFMQSLGNSFGTLGASSGSSAATYGVSPGALYGNGIFAGSPLGHHHHHHATLSGSSAGGLITDTNVGLNYRSSGRPSGGNVVQNFINATLNQLSGGNHHGGNHQSKQQFGSTGHPLHPHHTMHANGGPNNLHLEKQLFASPASQQQQQQQQRNHYHQTLNNINHQHTMLLNAHQQQQQPPSSAAVGADMFKYRTLSQAGAQQQQQTFLSQQQIIDPQLHIYDDLVDSTTTTQQPKRSGCLEIEPTRISIESVIGRGEFGDVCLATLSPPQNNLDEQRQRVAVKTLKTLQANDKTKLDFLIEAAIMSQFKHPNIINLEGIVTRSEPSMIVTEFMENGSLDSYLRLNKGKFTYLQLISMLRGIANGMQYLAKLNYVHKDLAARNILVNEQNVCKIADFGLSAQQNSDQVDQFYGLNSADSSASSSGSQHTLSSSTGGNQTNTPGAGSGAAINQLQSLAEQIAQQRFSLQQQLNQAQQQPLPSGQLAIQSAKIPVKWTALEAIAFRNFTSASDVWSFGIVCWEVMSEGDKPYWSWTNQQVIKALEQGYRLPQPMNCPEQLYQLMLDCWLKERVARPTFGQILKILDRMLSPYDDPFCHQQLVSSQLNLHTRIPSQEPTYYDTATYNPISQLISNGKTLSHEMPKETSEQQATGKQLQSVKDWLHSLKLAKYIDLFQRNQIDSLQYVARLNQNDLHLIGITNGQHIKKLLNAIAALRSTASIGSSGEGYLV